MSGEDLRVKKFIKKIDYSKEEITITFYYKKDYEKEGETIFGSTSPHSAAAKNDGASQDKKIPYISRDIGDDITWLPKPESTQTIDIILSNIIHGCKKKNLAARRASLKRLLPLRLLRPFGTRNDKLVFEIGSDIVTNTQPHKSLKFQMER